jgi:hypothetical protein
MNLPSLISLISFANLRGGLAGGVRVDGHVIANFHLIISLALTSRLKMVITSNTKIISFLITTPSIYFLLLKYQMANHLFFEKYTLIQLHLNIKQQFLHV